MTNNCGLCRDCKNWLISPNMREFVKDYPKNVLPKDGWLIAPCPTLKNGVEIEASSGGWGSGATVDSVETDGNFGCIYFSPLTDKAN